MPSKGYRHLSIREEVYEKLEEFTVRKGLSTTADAIVVLLDYADIYSKIEYLLQKGVSLPQSGVKETQGDSANQSSIATHSRAANNSVKSKQYATKGSKVTAWDILKRDKITCASSIKAKNPVRIIESLFEKGAVRIDLGRDVCVVYPEFWWRFWDTLDKLKTPNDEENLKEIKDEKMKWLYTVLRKEGIIVLDSTRKPPVWTFNKRVEIPEKAFEIRERGDISGSDKASPGEVEEHYEPVELYR
jgi:hypothetical protein